MGSVKEKQRGNQMVLTLFLAMLSGSYFQYMLSPMAVRIMEELQFTQTEFSSIFSAPMIPAIFLGIVAGILADRFGVGKIITIGLAVATLGIAARPFASGYLPFLLCMICGGLGTTFLNANNAKIISHYYEPEKIGNVMGIVLMGSTVGMTVATATSAMFPSLTMAFHTATGIQILVLLFWIWCMKNEKGEKTDTTREEISLKMSLYTVLKCRHIWIIGLCLACIMGCNTALSGFLPMALQSRGFSETTAGFLASGQMVGSFLGTFFGPRIIAKLPGKRISLLICALTTAFFGAVGWLAPGYIVFIALLLCGFGLGAMMPILLSMPIQLAEIGPIHAGTAGGIVTTIELLGAVVIPTYVITPLSGDNYQMFFSLAGGVMVIMALLQFLLSQK